MTKWGHRRVAVPTPANVRHWPEEKLFSVELSPVRVQKRRIRLISKCKAGPLLLAPAFLPSSVLRQAHGGRGEGALHLLSTRLKVLPSQIVLSSCHSSAVVFNRGCTWGSL